MKRTLSARILTHIKRYPGTTAWGVAKALRADSGTVSGLMHRMFREGHLARTKKDLTNEKEGWKYSYREPFEHY